MKTATCIVGLVHKNKVYMGGDSAGVSGSRTVTRSDPKVFKKDKMIFGFSSSFRMGQLLRYKLWIPDRDKSVDTYEYMVTRFIDSVRDCFKQNGFSSIINNEESGGQFLVGYEKKLFRIDHDFQVGFYTYPYNCIGCGEEIALGSMFSTEKMKDPKKRIHLALSAAEEFSGSVKKPFVIESI